ncbi:MAG TPA: glycosyltransferase family 39 protein [Chthoniobacterales bacterium]|jgi:4-amino-4-deoxy-L-arabinose transferase-like glycosyltransferase|nr:glycosyltransferase family 39 protein [Chthoniobacterales bacterium]
MPVPESLRHKIDIVLLAIIFAIGIFLRLTPHAFSPGGRLHSIAFLHPQPAFDIIGFDEGLYREYVNALSNGGLGSYPDIVQGYIDVQKKLPSSILPPLRFLYIFTAYAWHSIFGSEALDALRQVAAFFSMLTLALAAMFAWRIRGTTSTIAIAALMAVAPTQLHMSQHALVDGFFTFWALLVLWLLWELLRAPRDWRWLVGYIVALVLLVLTKENSFFVWIALVALIVTNRWLQFGIVTRELVIATFLGPLLGVVVLIFLAGGIDIFVQSYQLSVGKNFQLPYAILTGDGPWYRYLVDLLLVSPIVLLLALATIFRLNRAMKPELFMSVFIAASYLVMCNVKYGMNLRYANMWDMPLRFLAFSQIVALTSWMKSYRSAVIGAAVVFLAAIEFHQYIVLAVRYPLYELVTYDLLLALKILKSP